MCLSKNQTRDVCCSGDGSNQCRYFDSEFYKDNSGNSVYANVCRKKSPAEKKVIDDEVEEFLKNCQKNNQDPDAQNVPLGDHCQGYLPLLTKLQGYDVK